MADISPNYASPGLRWALLLEDHPQAKSEYTTARGTDLGIDADKGGSQDFIVCTITFGPGSDREPAVGWKRADAWPQRKDGTRISYEDPSDVVDINRTKARGRALKNAGYPADMKDLLAAMSWRKRNREMEAMLAGRATVALEQAQPELALTAAAKRDGAIEVEEVADAPETDTVADDEPAGDPEPDAPDAPADDVDLDAPPSEETTRTLKLVINRLNAVTRSPELTKFARSKGYRVTRPATEGHARILIEQGEKLLAEEDGAPANPEPDPEAPFTDPPKTDPPKTDPPAADAGERSEVILEVAELAAGLEAAEAHAYKAFLQSIDLNIDTPPGDWSDDQLAEILTWLRIGDD